MGIWDDSDDELFNDETVVVRFGRGFIRLGSPLPAQVYKPTISKWLADREDFKELYNQDVSTLCLRALEKKTKRTKLEMLKIKVDADNSLFNLTNCTPGVDQQHGVLWQTAADHAEQGCLLAFASMSGCGCSAFAW